MKTAETSVTIGSDAIVLGAFVLMFPGYFAYHLLLARGVIPGYLGGYSTAAAAIAMLPLALFNLSRPSCFAGRVLWLDALFLGFVAFFAAIATGHFWLSLREPVAVPHIGIAIQFVSLFLFFRVVNFGSRRFVYATRLSFIFISLLTFLHVSDGAFGVLDPNVDPMTEQLADYQGYAFIFLVVTICSAVTFTSLPGRMAVYLTACPALFLIGARSEFIAFFFGALAVEFGYSAARSAVVITLAGTLILVGSILTSIEIDDLPETRVTGLLRYSQDESALERARLSTSAWKSIESNPFLGAYGSYPVGEYAHNVLSAWVDLGFVGLVWFLGLLTLCGWTLLLSFGERRRSPLLVLALAFLGIEVLLVLAAKNFTYQMFPIAVGSCVQCFHAFRARPIRANRSTFGAADGACRQSDPD